MIENIFSSFKSKLHELKGTNQKSLQSVMTKVTHEAGIETVYSIFILDSKYLNIGFLSSSRFNPWFQNSG